ncbi:hypothetical protein VNO77_04427 [Canavalia gladiata]|uniref:Uncharacterized protein n=1 Tax=Canavalia gladiata TaxID=3824 RepID=A0AAN9N1M6_CANGL
MKGRPSAGTPEMARHFPLSQSPEVRRIPCGFHLQRSALFCGSVVNPRRGDSHSGFSHPVTARSRNGSVLTRRLNPGLAFVGRASTTTRFTLCLASVLDRHPTASQWWRGASPILLFHGEVSIAGPTENFVVGPTEVSVAGLGEVATD